MAKPVVLMVLGEYYPEVSGGGLQARELIRVLRDRVDFSVLTTSSVKNGPEDVEGIPVHRVRLDIADVPSQIRASLRFAGLLLGLVRAADIVHLNGITRKNVIVTVLAKLFRKDVILTLHSGGHDDLATIKAKSVAMFWSVKQATRVVGVSNSLRDATIECGIRAVTVSNGVDTARFHPVETPERREIRRKLSLPEDKALILFVGFFSQEKGPHRLFAAWQRLPVVIRERTELVFVGRTKGPHTEVDPTLADAIKRDAGRVSGKPIFVERTAEIEQYYQASDMFVLASTREGCPVALLEAMATGLPIISTRLPGSTDSIIDHAMNGHLVEPGDIDALSSAMLHMLSHPDEAGRLGRAARQVAQHSLSIAKTASAYLGLYGEMTRAAGDDVALAS